MMKGKFLVKQFLFFVLALSILLIVSVLLFVLINYHVVNQAVSDKYPVQLYNEIEKHNKITKNAKTMMNEHNIWLIIIDENGDVRDSYRKPDEVPNHFEINDVAKFTRWYLEDYPVFTYIYNKELLVIAYPKGYYAKIASNYFKPSSSFQILKSIGIIVIIDLSLLFILYFYSKRKIVKEIKPIRDAIKKLSQGEKIQEQDCHDLSEILEELRMASDILEAKNSSKNKWLRGVTHDIRTPLTVVMAYAEELSERTNDEKEKLMLHTIKTKAELINKILESLNTMYSLEDKSDLKKETINFNKLIKNIAIDYINTYDIEINVVLPEIEQCIVAKEVLIERLIRNIIDNSIKHNDDNIIIDIILDETSLTIQDNGNITKNEALHLNSITDEYTTKDNGYGILIVKKIVSLYKMNITFDYNKGLKTTIKF